MKFLLDTHVLFLPSVKVLLVVPTHVVEDVLVFPLTVRGRVHPDWWVRCVERGREAQLWWWDKGQVV